MDKKIEYIGYWYLPNNDKRVIAGTLTYIPHISISLELVGDFPDVTDPVTANIYRPNPNPIFGVAYDVKTKKKFKKISLLNCDRNKITQNLSCNFPITEYKASYIVIGSHINNVDNKLFSESTAIINAMNKWCHPSILKNSYPTEDNEINGVSVSFLYKEVKEPINSITIGNNISLNIERGVAYNEDTSGKFNISFSQYTTFKLVSKTNLSITDIIKLLNNYEQFISFMSLCNVYVNSIYLRDNNSFVDLGNGEKLFNSIELIYINQHSSDTPKYYLANYEKIKDIYPMMITKWYELSTDLAPIRNHLIKSLRYKMVFDYSDFVIVAHALEGYYIRFVDNKSKKIMTRYENLFNKFKNLKVFNHQSFNSKAAADSRNYYSHFYEKESNSNVLDGLELHKLYRQMRVLLICCILELIGLDIETIDTITSSSNSDIFR